jgi:hypothetical protein
METVNIIQNAIRTPDGEILNSLHRHHFITHKVGDTLYMVDGGLDYIRRSGEDYEDLTLTNKDSIEDIKLKLLIKVNNKWVKIIECSDKVIKSVVNDPKLPSIKKHICLEVLNDRNNDK